MAKLAGNFLSRFREIYQPLQGIRGANQGIPKFPAQTQRSGTLPEQVRQVNKLLSDPSPTTSDPNALKYESKATL
jgi:hypothetical protein